MIRSIYDLPKLLAVFVIITCMLVPGLCITAWRYQAYLAESARIERDITDQTQDELKEQMKIILTMINTKRSILTSYYRARIKSRVDELHAVLFKEFNAWQAHPVDKLTMELMGSLSAFNGNLDHQKLIAFDGKGRSLFYPFRHVPVNTSLLKEKDADGRYFIKDLIPFLTRYQDTMQELVIPADASDRKQTQIVYLRFFRPTNWFIGYAINQFDMESEFRNEILQILQKYRYKKEGYIMTMNADGFVLNHGAQPQHIGRDGKLLKNDQGVYVVQNIMEAATRPDGGFCQYTWYNPATKISEPKLTYSVQIPDWGWTVATGVYLNEIRDRIGAQKQQFKRQAIKELALICVMWLVCSLGAWFLAHRVQRVFSRDFKAFASFFQQAAQNYETIEPESLNLHEFKRLAGYANEMVKARQNSLKQLDVQRHELEEARKKAESASLAKGQFLANMSHEIRTPMNGVIGMLDLLMDSHLSEDQKDLTQTAKISADSLLSLINDILDFSKIEAGKLEFDMLDFNIRDLLESAAEILSVHASKKGIELAFFIDSNIPSWFHGDPGRIRQIIINLSGNAIKFTEQGTVSIRVTLDKELPDISWLKVEVQDNGPGIVPERLDRLFKSFSQVDASTTRRYGGTGLGLAISKQLTDLMGGQIGVSSEPDKGSVFWFTIPLEKRQAPETPPSASIDQITGRRILVVDDNATNRDLFCAYLTLWGCRHKAVKNGHEALAELRSAAANGQAYEAALVDYMMPGMGGDQLGKRIKEDTRIRHIALIMLTSRGMRGDAQRMREIGFMGYLTKPIKRQDLLQCLLKVLLLHTARDESGTAQRQLITRHSLKEDVKGRPRLLVVEDNPVNQKVALLHLKKLGYHADIAANGLEAVAALSKTRYILVLMDQQMPEMDGLTATRTIRASNQVLNPKVPIIAMTANALKGDKEKCIAAGMNDYLSKPISAEKIKRKIEKWLNK